MSRNQLDIPPITDKIAMPDIEALKSDKQLNEFSQVTYKVECDIIRCRGVSMLYEYLLDTFGTNESIFVSDIKYETYSRPWIDKQLSKLCRAKKIIRYERGILQTPFYANLNL